MIEDVKIKIKDVEHILPNLNFDALEKLDALRPGLAPLAFSLKNLIMALNRKYPDMTEDFLRMNLEDYEFEAAIAALNELNTRKKKYVAQVMAQFATGAQSTQELLPPQDGAGNT